jgi:hypothetical protein
MSRFFVVSVGLIVAIGGRHADGEDSQAPATELPWGLGSYDMPGEASSLAAMPATLDGVVRVDSSPLGVVCAEGGGAVSERWGGLGRRDERVRRSGDDAASLCC